MNIQEIENRIGQMEQELKALRSHVAALRSGGTPAAPGPVSPAAVHPPKPPGRIALFLQNLREENMEIFLGGNVLGKLGIVAIVLAAAWFIKLAFDNQWVNESGRIYTGLLTGFIIMAFAAYLGRRLMRVVPAPLLGAGITVLYLSVFSAYHFYGLLNVTETFAAMVLLSAYATFLSVTANRQSLYMFGLLGAFLAPVMLSRGENSYRFLFTYTAVIQAGYLWVSTKRIFTASGWLVLIGSAVTWGGWSAAYMDKSNYWVPLAILVFTFCVFFARQILVSYVLKGENRIFDAGLLPGSLLFLSIAGYALTHHHFKSATGHFLLLCVWLLAGSLLVLIRFQEKQPENAAGGFLLPVLAYEALAMVFAALTDYFDGRWMTLSWILFAAALSMAALRLKKEIPLVISIVVWVIALLRLIFLEHSMPPHMLLLNARFALFVLAGAGMTAAYLVHKKNPFVTYAKAFAFGAMFCFVWASLLENRDAVETSQNRNLGYSYVLAAYAVLFLVYGFMKNHKTLRLSGIVLAVLVVGKLYFWDIWALSRLVRILAFFSLGVALLVLSILYQKYRDRIIQLGKTLMMFLIVPAAVFMTFMAPDGLSAEKFRKESFKNKTTLQPLRPDALTDKSITYGKLTLTPEMVRTGNSSMRVSYRGKALPSFLRRAEDDKSRRGFMIPQVIFAEMQRYGATYVLKLPEPPEGTEWQELHLASDNNFEAGVHVQSSDEPRDWAYIGHRSVFHYGGPYLDGGDGMILRVDAQRARYLRLEFTRPVSVTFSQILYAKKGPESAVVEIPADQWKKSSDSDRQATILEFANSEKRKIERLVLAFKQEKFSRRVEIYTFNDDNRSYQLSNAAYLSRRKNDKEDQVIDLGFAATGAIKLVIMDEDDEPLDLVQSRAYSPVEQLVFRLPEDASSEEPLIVYSGNPYIAAPSFDIGTTFDEKAPIAEFRAGSTDANQEFAYSAMEPPVSSWIMRAVFIIGLAGLGFPCYRIFRKYSETN